jgi:NAD(P)-dependent dehydrogenase (short-subunit alcohol dehydrogenase family)
MAGPTSEQTHWWITGAGSGMGQQLAWIAAAEGARVTISGRRPAALAETAAGHDRIHSAPLDVKDQAAIEAAVKAMESQKGPIDVAVLNAAFYQPMDAADFDSALFRETIETNVMGVVNCLQAVLPRMLARGHGHLVIVASVAGYRGLPRAAAYGPSKAALINLAESLQPSAAAAGVRVQVVNPGFVATPLTAANKFHMPFLITAEDAARRIYRGIGKGGFEIAFPWPFVMLLKIAGLLPDRLYFALTARMIT